MTKSQRLPTGYNVKRYDHLEQGIDYIGVGFPRTGGRSHGSIIPTASEFYSPRTLANALKDRGAVCPKNHTWDSLVKLLQAAVPDKAGNATSTYGWKEAAGKAGFILPGRSFGNLSLKFIPMKHNKDICQATEIAGSFDIWRKKVALPAGISPIVAAALLTSLAAPLFRYSGLSEAFLLNLAGTSSTGKTTANIVAASPWYGIDGLWGWRSTDRGFEEALAAHNDRCLIPDDIEQGQKTKHGCFDMIEQLTHSLTSGKGKNYSSVVSNENQLARLRYACLILSSSPETVESHQRQHGKVDRENSHRARLLEMKVSTPAEGGIWAAWNGHAKRKRPAEKSIALRQAAESNFGVAGQEWIKFLVKHHAKIPSWIEILTQRFIDRNAPNASDVERRIASKIGLLYATAIIAEKAGILPWSHKRCRELAGYIYQAVLEAGFPEKLEEGHFISALTQRFQDDSFPVYRSKKLGSIDLPKGAIGFVHEPAGRAYLRLDEFERFCSSCLSTRSAGRADVESMISALKQRKFLLPGHGKYHTQDIRLANGKPKLLVFQLSAFEI